MSVVFPVLRQDYEGRIAYQQLSSPTTSSLRQKGMKPIRRAGPAFASTSRVFLGARRPCRELRPGFFNGGNELPFGFDFVATSKQSRVAAHRVEEEGLVGDGSFSSKCFAIAKIKLHVGGVHLRSRTLRGKVHSDSLVRLNTKCHDIAMNFLVRLVREQRLRSSLEVHCDFGEIARQALACTNQE